MDFQTILDHYYPDDDDLRRLLLFHSRQVAERALATCRKHPELGLDTQFVLEAAMLHDIGIRWCHAPSIFCRGDEHYLRHGYIGGQLLREEGFPLHARVCERHTGTGITQAPTYGNRLGDSPSAITHRPDDFILPPDLVAQGFFVPETLEEQLVCYADKFFSKSHPSRVLTIEQAAHDLERFGHEGVEKFISWAQMFD